MDFVAEAVHLMRVGPSSPARVCQRSPRSKVEPATRSRYLYAVARLAGRPRPGSQTADRSPGTGPINRGPTTPGGL